MQMRNTLQGKVIRMFLLIMVISVLMCGWLIYRWHFQEARRDYGVLAERGASLVADYLMDIDVEAVLQNGQDVGYQADMRRIQSICNNFALKYLYVYLPNIEKNEITMVYVTTSDASLRDNVGKKRGLGTVVKRELVAQELAVYTGESNSAVVMTNNEFGNVVTWYDALKNADGKIIGLIGADVEAEIIQEDIILHTLWTTLIVLVGLTVVLCVLLLLLNRSVLQPVRTLSRYMENFKAHGELGESEQKLLNLSSKDEIGGMTESFQKMVHDIDTYAASIACMTAAREREMAELDVAQRIQLGMLPQSDRYADRQEIALGAYMMPAKEIGGDLYDFFFIDETHFCTLIGDVSGKGITAALFMSMTRTLLKDYLLTTGKPETALQQANARLCAENPEGMFVTVFVGILDTTSGEYVYANAGHNYPVFGCGKKEFIKTKNGIPLGVIETAKYSETSIILRKEDEILLYTDGVTEAQTQAGELFGDDRLLQNCSDMKKELKEQEKIKMIQEAINVFVGEAEQFDDITMLLLRYNGNTR